jgi:hypothetical protein
VAEHVRAQHLPHVRRTRAREPHGGGGCAAGEMPIVQHSKGACKDLPLRSERIFGCRHDVGNAVGPESVSRISNPA